VTRRRVHSRCIGTIEEQNRSRVRHTLAQAIHRFFDENGFFWVNTPIITSSNAGALFRVSTLDLANLRRTQEGEVDFAQDFFGPEAFLTVSGQLNVEAYCLALTKVYTFGPTFRAENTNTSRHLAEFWMIEPEIAFADLSDNAALAEALLKYTFAALLNEREEDLAFFDQRIEKGLVAKLEGIVGSEFVHMDYGEAIQVLERAIIGGSQREERLDVLDRNMAERGIDREHYAWYRDLRRYGTVPHAGFGLGFERTLAYVTGLTNVRDAIPFPRTRGAAKY
jgi:asparaginyl-tRNA synthetase